MVPLGTLHFSETLRLQKNNMTSAIQDAKDRKGCVGVGDWGLSLHQSLHQSAAAGAEKSQRSSLVSRREGNTRLERDGAIV